MERRVPPPEHALDEKVFEAELVGEQEKSLVLTEQAVIVALVAGPNLLTQHYSDHGNAERFVALHGDNVRFWHERKKWLLFDGKRWMTDGSEQALQLARLTMVEFLRQAVACGAEKAQQFAGYCLNTGAVNAMLKMARPVLTISAEDLDKDPFQLNFTNGTVDLRTGELHLHRREQFITKIVHYPYDPKARCPVWEAFLSRIMKDDFETLFYLQKAIGYSLTASTIEKALFVPFGEGNNGKSTLLTTIARLVREYAASLQIESLLTRQGDSNNAQADLADLLGARFAQTSEAESGQALSQGKLKRLTQGMGKIKAFRKYENAIEFTETHKLWLDTNRKPRIPDADDQATWNRLHPIPFDVVIPKEEIDRELPAKLLAEAEGILAWAVEGAIYWHATGLEKPSVVVAACQEWREESNNVSDELTAFVEERCQREGSVSGEAFYAAYKKWAGSQNRTPIDNNKFASWIVRLGIEKKRTSKGVEYRGIQLRKGPKASFLVPNDGM